MYTTLLVSSSCTNTLVCHNSPHILHGIPLLNHWRSQIGVREFVERIRDNRRSRCQDVAVVEGVNFTHTRRQRGTSAKLVHQRLHLGEIGIEEGIRRNACTQSTLSVRSKDREAELVRGVDPSKANMMLAKTKGHDGGAAVHTPLSRHHGNPSPGFHTQRRLCVDRLASSRRTSRRRLHGNRRRPS